MAKTKKTTKKTIRLQVIQKLEEAFSDLEKVLGKTKFKRSIKKAGKALTADLKSPKKAKETPAKKKKNKKAKPAAPAS